MSNNALKQLGELGQSPWLDYISRDLIESGELRRLIEEDGLQGLTSNPDIFEKAITGSTAYDLEISELAALKETPQGMYEILTVGDVRRAADEFRRLYESSNGKHGYVSLEVNPHLAHNLSGTIEEARRLWVEVDRPNIFIKVPATKEGLQAIRQLIREGINVNVTLLFGLPRYKEVAEAYLAGIEERLEQGGKVSHVASVASFFLSRIDVLIDPKLEEIAAGGGEKEKLAKRFKAEVATASAKLAYKMYKEIFLSSEFKELAAKGARPQRLLWASTGTKNPEYSDVKYIEPLIGSDTVNTMPRNTLDAYRHHGSPAVRVEEGLEEAGEILLRLPELGINLDSLTQQLEDDGIAKFIKPYDLVMNRLAERLSRI